MGRQQFEKEVEDSWQNKDLWFEAEDSWQNKDFWFKVNTHKSSYKTGFIDGYNKANEWNNVKDKLPVSDRYKTYIVIDKYDCSTIARFDDGKWLGNLAIENVVLWKEVTFPSYKEFMQAVKENKE